MLVVKIILILTAALAAGIVSVTYALDILGHRTGSFKRYTRALIWVAAALIALQVMLGVALVLFGPAGESTAAREPAQIEN